MLQQLSEPERGRVDTEKELEVRQPARRLLDTNRTWLLMSPLVVPLYLTLPQLVHCLVPCSVRHAVSNDQNPIPGFTRRLMNR